MSTRAHDDEWFEPPLAEGLAENNRGEVADAAIGVLILVVFLLFLVGVSSAFVLGAFYLKSHVMDLPFLGQYFGD
jgi:hypothetical protein